MGTPQPRKPPQPPQRTWKSALKLKESSSATPRCLDALRRMRCRGVVSEMRLRRSSPSGICVALWIWGVGK